MLKKSFMTLTPDFKKSKKCSNVEESVSWKIRWKGKMLKAPQTNFWQFPRIVAFGVDISETIGMVEIIRYRKAKIDCLSFVYVSASSAAHNRLLFFFFLLRPFTVLMKKTRPIKQSIFLRCLWLRLMMQFLKSVDIYEMSMVTS